ncbi:putative VWFA domain-containing protein [Dirofilaria immitis]
MWFVWVSVVHLHFIRINAQFSDQVWQYRSPNKHQVMGNPSLLPHHQQLYPKISMPVYGFNPNFYPIPFPISVQPSLPLRAFTVPTISLQNLPFQSAWMTSNSPLFTNQNKFVGYITEIKKSDDVMNSILTKTGNHYNISAIVRNNLPDFLYGTSDNIQKRFYKIVLNPDENFQQKQSKLDQLVSTLESKNQELYDHYRRRKELEETKKRNRVHGIVATMSGKAQAVFAKLSEVLMNPEMKDLDRVNKINDFYKSVDEDIKKEFKDKIRGIGNYN